MTDILNNDFVNDEDGIEIVDLDGEPFEIIGELEYEGEIYLALTPYKEGEEAEAEDDEIEFIMLKEEQEGDDCVLATIDDDSFYEKIGKLFLKMFAGELE